MQMAGLSFSQLPGANSLFLDFVEHPDRVTDLYASRQELPPVERAHRSALVDILQRQNQSYANRTAGPLLDKLRKSDTYCVITGQQVGLLTGPMYSLWKALTALRFCEQMEQKGISCVPVFWMASEDHNLHELLNFALLKQDFELLEFSLKEHLFLSRQPTGSIPTNHKEVRPILLRAFSEIKIAEIKEIYSKGTLATAFARTLLWLLRDFPVLIVDPSDPELKKLAAPFFTRFFERSQQIQQSLQEQNESLKARRYPSQVRMEGNLPLFYIEGQERAHYKDDTLTMPVEKLSPAALLRPLFEDFLFPTLAYVGGPAEIAYFAQLHPWYEILQIKQPWLLHRASVTLIPPITRSFLDSRKLRPEELYMKEDTLFDALVENSALKEIRAKLKELEAQVEKGLSESAAAAERIEKTLRKNIETSQRKIQYQLQKIDRKAFYAVKRKDQILYGQIRKAKNVIYPKDKLQERHLNIFCFAARLPDLVAQVYPQIETDSREHVWIDI
jgi:uncharacterized protein YllA (UPF0747 family)